MSEQTNEERARFHAWVQDRGCDTDGAWSAWQAAKSESALALSLARSALEERERCIQLLEEALRKFLAAQLLLPQLSGPAAVEMIEASQSARHARNVARSVLNKENGNG